MQVGKKFETKKYPGNRMIVGVVSGVMLLLRSLETLSEKTTSSQF